MPLSCSNVFIFSLNCFPRCVHGSTVYEYENCVGDLLSMCGIHGQPYHSGGFFGNKMFFCVFNVNLITMSSSVDQHT